MDEITPEIKYSERSNFKLKPPCLCASVRSIPPFLGSHGDISIAIKCKRMFTYWMEENKIGSIIVNTAVQLHKELGPGLLESVYEVLLARRLQKFGLEVKRQVSVPIKFDGEIFDEGFRADLIVEGLVIIELKSVEKLHPSYKKQVLTYLRLADLKLGYLLNFGDALMKNGISRIIDGDLN